MKKIAIRERLILYFVLLGLLSIATISLFSIYEARKGIVHRTYSQLILLRDIRKEQILTFYQTRCNELLALSASGSIKDLAMQSLTNNVAGKAASLRPLELSPLNLVTDNSFCKALYFISGSGLYYEFSDSQFSPDTDSVSVSFVNYLDILSQIKTNTGDPEALVFEHIDAKQQAHTLAAAPVYCWDTVLCGTLVMEIQPNAIYRIMYRTVPGSGLGKTGEAYLVGPDNLMRSPSRFVNDAVMKETVKSEGVIKSLQGQEGIGIYTDYRGFKVLGAYGQLNFSGIHQVILAEIDNNEAMVPLYTIRNEILLLSVGILLIIFIITWFLAYGITRPLIKLINAANFISSGNYDQQLEIAEDDEIGDLTRSFNVMAKEIKSTTLELKENEERLSHFYQATLDGIMLHDNSSLLLFNSALLRLTGYSGEELSALKVQNLLQAVDMTQCDNQTQPRTYESMMVRKDGTGLAVEVQESCIDFEGKSIQASVIRDISARKEMESQLAVERNKRIRAVFDGQDLEQQRLSRELHDGLGQQLVAGKLILESMLYSQGEIQKERITEVQRIFDLIIGDIRRISHNLSPSILQAFGLKAAMENLCNSQMKASGIRIGLSVDLGGYDPGEMTSTYLFRISQESLNNVQRHAGATEAKVSLKTEGGLILLEIEDNGKGYNPDKVDKKGGNGLYNIRERVNILKGNLTIKSRPGWGTKIKISIPQNIDPYP